ncbi:CapA family protein [Salinicoccus hispanicus]|uniref:CapA family protein n=1 Tax=Salinicoccus hispanicus TaxID=157225 RepID=A0A6N8TZB7_9STAP|nr:CapA family protein [Salinicoccus hispanicus]MXQ50903.1 CapA family protein [Salinicoccus hispanicus]
MIRILMFMMLSWPFGGEVDSAVHEAYAKDIGPVSGEKIDHVVSTYFEKSFTFAATGDVLIHDHLYEDVATESGYDFISRVDEVAPYLKNQDLVFLNQETPIGGEELRLSGYPAFNAPLETADLLEYLNADIVSLANNHALDRSTLGVEKTTEILNEKGIEYVGANASAEDAARERVIEVDGIEVGFLAYTYGTNGIPVPQGQEYLVNFIDMPTILSDMEALRDAVDLLVVSMHQGVEYAPLPREDHVIQFEQIAEAGADIVLGHHPHVLQPVDIYEREDGGETIIAYSLANFFSAQQDLQTKLGGIIEFDVRHQVNGGETAINGIRFMPTYVHSNEYTDFELVPLADAEAYGMADAADIYSDVSEHMRTYTDELEVVQYLE